VVCRAVVCCARPHPTSYAPADRQVSNEVARHEPDQNDGPTSFDLYAFPASGPRTVPEVHQLMEAGDPEDPRFDSEMGCWFPPPGPQMATFIDELERRWPSLEIDPDGSPWSSWPLWQPTAGGGMALNISWSAADSVVPAILEIAVRANVSIYDPQNDELIHPPPDSCGGQ
jgi:hypothetical protein